MPSLPESLAAILQEVKRPGDYYASGATTIHLPCLEVEGVGTVALPLLPVQAQQLVDVAEQAPYGRGTDILGTDTLVDTEVRRTWQIEAERMQISGKRWQQDLDAMVEQAAEGLGVGGPVAAELYKLLVYEAGSFFVEHRDTEKAPGMFATLVVVLPYHSDQQRRLVEHLSGWAGGAEGPDKLVYPLEHAYTETEIGFPALKGSYAAAEEAGCEVMTALLRIQENGIASTTAMAAAGGGGTRTSRPTRTSRSSRSQTATRPCPIGGARTAAPRPWASCPSGKTRPRRRVPWTTPSPTRWSSTRPPATRAPASTASTAADWSAPCKDYSRPAPASC